MRKNTLLKIIAVCVVVCFLLTPCLALAHSGRTDSNGGHYDRSTGEYHYHHGYPPHQHPGGVCEYEYDDRTGSTSGSSSSNSLSSNPGYEEAKKRAEEYEESKKRAEEQERLLREQEQKRKEEERKEQEEAQRKKRRKIALTCVGCAIVGCWYFEKPKKKKKNNPSPQKPTAIQKPPIPPPEDRIVPQTTKPTPILPSGYVPYKTYDDSVDPKTGLPDRVEIGGDGLPRVTDAKYMWGRRFTVYVTPNGKKYHRSKCKVIDGKNKKPIHRYTAISREYTPCFVCRPRRDIEKWYLDYKKNKEQ